ncbi:protein transport protein sec61 subunit gamma [Plakobranchus ocellatus]|uniref:Protein transport protein sec61 subunit gamma n=2 Tax=Plakobranchidae TaxID=71492 RepID=A0AAV4AWX1_9GAST|nr:protein transport protein sec61 subunit gamma [Plakobranchus ocellatus]
MRLEHSVYLQAFFYGLSSLYSSSCTKDLERAQVHHKRAMDQVMQFIEPAKTFTKDSIRLVKKCTKPDRKEFQKIAMATAIGFAIMGFIGFFVKLIHIPINNIIVGS